MDEKQPLGVGCHDEVGGVPAPAHAGLALHQRGHASLPVPSGRVSVKASTSRLCKRVPATLLSLLP